MFFIREGTHLYKFLMILACVGEYPVKSVHLLGYERVWKQKINEWHKYQIYCLPGTNEKVRAQLLSISGKTPYKTIRLNAMLPDALGIKFTELRHLTSRKIVAAVNEIR